ncbi:DUF3987 domain-containing protein, partial [Roseomonas sp. M0104]
DPEVLLDVLKDIARAAGVEDELIGVEEVASDAGIVSAVAYAPSQVMLLDEIGSLIEATNNGRSALYVQNVKPLLLKLYSSTRTTFKSKSYRDRSQVQIIDQPCVSLLGCSTPESLFSALQSKDIANGLLSRMVLFSAGDHDPLGRPPERCEVPQDLIDWVRTWRAQKPAGAPGHLNERVEPIQVGMTPAAMEIAQRFDAEMHAQKAKARKHGLDALYARATENALKFALIRTCAPLPAKTNSGFELDYESLCVDEDTMLWACHNSRATIDEMSWRVLHEIADTQFEKYLKAVRSAVHTAGPAGLTQSALDRHRATRVPKAIRDDVMEALKRSGEVTLHALKTGERGRPPERFIHKDFLSKAQRKALEDADEAASASNDAPQVILQMQPALPVRHPALRLSVSDGILCEEAG